MYPGALHFTFHRSFRLIGALLAAAVMALVPGAAAQQALLPGKTVERYTDRYGSAARARLDAWQELMRDHHHAEAREKLRLVNDFFNEVPWLDDSEHWGKRDYWATPLEMLGTHGGDCEDFSIAKYITLVNMGVKPESLRITYVRAPRLKQPHMVLAWYPRENGEPLILDNLDKEIRPASQRTDLIPVYSFNARNLWASGRDDSRRLGGAGRLKAWREVSRRIRLEGVNGSE